MRLEDWMCAEYEAPAHWLDVTVKVLHLVSIVCVIVGIAIMCYMACKDWRYFAHGVRETPALEQAATEGGAQ